jgi:1-hydroxycarotenoid 3,4-desaturase
MGGLTAAALLAARGVSVTLLDKEAGPGGKVRQLPVGSSHIDAGPTVFTLRDVFEDIFDQCGATLDSEVRLHRAHILARHAWDAGERLDLFADPRASAEAIGDFAGAEAAAGYRGFAAEAARIHAILDHAFMRASKTWPPGLMWRIGLWRVGALLAIRPYESLWKVLGEHFTDPRLRQLFGRYSTYCGSSPFQTPATLMLIAHVEALGVWLIDGGISALATALDRLATRNGATIRYGTGAARILVERERVTGVVTDSGERIAADAVIVNGDPAALAAGRFGAEAAKAVAPVPAARRSLSALTWLMEATVAGPPLVRHNVFFSSDYPAEFADLRAGRPPASPSVYLCALDRDAADAPADAGPQRVQIIVNAPANGDRHIYTSEEIERCTCAMLARLNACGLDLTLSGPPHIGTPNSFERLCPSTGGALYGRASHGWAASFLRQSSRTRIAGLYCAGGSTHPGAGVPMAALSGRLAVESVMRDRASTGWWPRMAMPGGMSTRSATTGASASPSSVSSAASSAPII